jgi:hypothetical protein
MVWVTEETSGLVTEDDGLLKKRDVLVALFRVLIGDGPLQK